uniref:Uncharacterized protein n=1 Tax=Phage sp. ct4bw6 TaxID=2826747 RepID=A0A8S5MUB0_9VIRU|nr:MAG TPA: hypothetical protein [Phage sp. ct4bw6]
MRYPVSWEALQARGGLSGRRRRSNNVRLRVATTSWNPLQGRAGPGQLNQPSTIIWVTEWTGGTPRYLARSRGGATYRRVSEQS